MTTPAIPRLARRHVRSSQRAAHLLAGVALLAYMYAAPLLGSGFDRVVRFGVIPMVVISGVALWKWPRIRTLIRGRT